MEDNLFWTIFEAVGTVLGAIATAIAVIVALWQTKHSNKKKLKLTFNDPITIVSSQSSERKGHYIGITITNIGNREVVVSDWSIIASKDNRYKIVTETQGLLSRTLPIRLPLEDSIDLSYERKFFVALVHDMIEKGEISPSEKVKFQIMDSTGKKYFVKSKFSASTYAKEKSQTRPK